MDIKKELVSCFEFMNLQLEPNVLSKCENLCKVYNVVPEDFCDIWCAFAASTMCTDAPSLEKLELVEKKLLKLKKDKPFPKTETFDDGCEYMGEESDANSGVTTTETHTKKIKQENQEIPDDLSIHKLLDEQRKNEDLSTNASTKYADRKNALLVKVQVGKPASIPIDTKKIVNISSLALEKALRGENTYLYELLGQKISCLNIMANQIGWNIATKNNIVLSSEFNMKNHIGPIVTHGRICANGNSKLDPQNILLEGTSERNVGHNISLNIDKLPGAALFPGQIVVVRGKMMRGNKLIAESLYTDGSSENPTKPAVTEEPIRIIAAAGPFTVDEDLKYDPVRDLLNYVAENQPHILMLIGPFVDENHPILAKGDIKETFEEFFEDLIGGISTALSDTNVRIILVSSMKDIHHMKVFPTPAYNLAYRYPNVVVVEDPSVLKLDDLLVGVTSVDVMYHIAQEELVTYKTSDTLARLPEHLLKQRTFYPLFPPSIDLNFSHVDLERCGMMDTLPHILLLPSKLKGFIKNIQGCVVINPEKLAKGKSGGAFTDITISPGVTPISERLHCKILNI